MDRSLKSRKRAFVQGIGEIDSSDMDVLEYSDSEEKMANLRTKGKEIMVQDVTVVDDDDGCLHMTDEAKLGGDYKGKGLLYASSSGSDSDDKKAPFFMEQSSSSTSVATEVVVDGDYLNNFTGQSSDTDQEDSNYFDDDDLDYHPENGWYGSDEISYLQTQFEKADIPSDIEVDIPWWSDPAHKNGKPCNMSGTSNGNGTQPMLDSARESPETKSTGVSISSAEIICTRMNGPNSLPCKHGSLPNNYAADSFAASQTETPGGSSGTQEPKSLKEVAIVRVQQFGNFAVVDDYSDHHYANRLSDMQLEKASTKIIMDEWRILQNSLPDTIFVRVYESQMALLRAVIIGPQGTPYHDGLFFFDVMFPSNYPKRPPCVYYYSGGLRINPNLYENGKVCLSLLGTWPGLSATENWIPGKSTLLQVLISIQGLILNANPYFNEPGFSRSGDRNASEIYNEETLLKSLKTMIYSMKKPPKHFAEFVPDHFITRSRDILLACNEYMKGAKVGYVSIKDGKAVKENNKGCSGSFRERVGCYLNSLIDEFAKLGVNDCDELRVPVSNIKEETVAVDSKEHLTWSEMPKSDPDFSPMLNMFNHEFGKAKFKKSGSQFPSASFPTAPGVAYPYPIPPSNMYAAPYPAAPPGDAFPLPPPFHLSTMTSQPVPHLVAYLFPPPPPHIAMSSSSTPWNPSLSLSVPGADPPIRFGAPASHTQNIRPVVNANSAGRFGPVPRRHRQNVNPFFNPDPPAMIRPSRPLMPNLPSGHHPRNHSWSKPDDDLKGNVHKWSDY